MGESAHQDPTLRTWGVPAVGKGGRRELRRRLDAWYESHGPLVVQAPSGYGKTTEVASWIWVRTDVTAIWISAGELVRGWPDAFRAVAAGLSDLGLIPQELAAVSDGAGLYVALQRLKSRVVVVIDNADSIDPISSLDDMERSLEQFPLLRVIVISPTPLRASRSHGGVFRSQLSSSDLAWTEDYAAEVIGRLGLSAPSTSLDRIVASSGGRASAVLFHVENTTGEDPTDDATLRRRWLDDRVGQVENSQDAAHALHVVAQFIQLPTELAFAVGIDQRSESFHGLIREGLIERVSGRGGVGSSGYRIAPHARELVASTSSEVLGDDLKTIHDRAIDYFLDRDERAPSIHHLARAGRIDEALDRFRQPLRSDDSSVGLADLRFALTSIPAAEFSRSPALLAMRVLLAQIPPIEPSATRSTFEARLLALPLGSLGALPLSLRALVVGAGVATHVARGRPADAVTHGRALARSLAELPWNELHELGRGPAILWVALAEAEFLEGRMRAASEYARAAKRAAEDYGHRFVLYTAEAILGAVLAIEGDGEGAEEHLMKAELLYSLGGWPPSERLYPVALGRLVSAVPDLDTPGMLRSAEVFAQIAPTRTSPWALGSSIAEIYLRVFRGDTDGAVPRARSVLKLARASTTAPTVLRSLVIALNADLLNIQGRAGAALEVVAGGPETPEHAFCHSARRATSYLLLGDAKLALSATDGCVRLGSNHTLRSLIPVLLRRAVAEEMLGFSQSADADFLEALSQMAVRPAASFFFGLDPAALHPLWQRLAATHPDIYEKTRLQDEIWVERFSEHPRSSLAGGLSTRERDILALLRSGATNVEIAEHLFISANTVKSHLKSLFRKLGVSSRREATDLADALGIAALDDGGA